jgi:hypothetical protein
MKLKWIGEVQIIRIFTCGFPFYRLGEFTKLLGYDYFCEGGEEVSLQHDCVCVDILDICECFGIDPKNILPKEND